MISAIRSSLSGLQAASRSLSARADNVANIRTTSRPDAVAKAPAPDDGVFRPYRVVNLSREGGGVDTTVAPTEPSHRRIYDPSGPKADSDGTVAAPNVNLEENLAGMRLDRHQFAANLAVIRTADEMAGTLLDKVA